ncbi:MAG: LLM class F420-dependent oxidoreductase [Myxococcales bacterium]|nr:LLM class F420-dependent oxidoreductase [Myxococcales bacterium]
MSRADENVRLGISLPLGSAATAVETALFARDRGLKEIWLAEVNGGDAYALAGALAVGAKGMPIGTAVTPAQTRTAFVHAMAGMTLSQLTGGQFVLGIGLSSPNIVRDWAGQPFDKPLARMRDHVTTIGSLLAGEKVNYESETLSMKKAKLGGSPDGKVPIYLGALNQKMLRLCGELCDGVILNMVPERALGQVLGEVRAGAEAAGRDPRQIEVVSRLHVLLTDSEDRGRQVVRTVFGPYAATPGYNRFFRWIGFDEEGKRIAECFAAKDRDGLAKAVTKDLCDAIAVVGDADKVRARLRAYAEQGVDVCVVNPLGDAAQARKTIETVSGCLDGLSLPGGGVARASLA